MKRRVARIVERRNCREKPPRVRVARVRKNVHDFSRFHYLARVHHVYEIHSASDKPKVVRDQENRHSRFSRKFLNEVQYLLLSGHVQRSSRLVRYEQLRFGGKRHCKDRALLLSAGKLAGVRAGGP